ncbi:MAG: hypothetical protein FOGNACKC_05499 [Anaerolineae bacterium]|nr:hypothetical protein [Anaerolineae bacterium]
MKRIVSTSLLTAIILLYNLSVTTADGPPPPLCDNPVPLADYPRPENDNGWGIHWGPGGAAQEPAAISFFVGELKQMNIRWVKILNRGTLKQMDPVVDALVGAGMMPVMRISVDGMAALYPPEVEALVRHYRGRGVAYFELYNEPNLLVEWPAGAGIDIGHTADVWIPAAAAVQNAGGFPSIPGLAPGGHWEDMDFLRRFLLEVRRRAENGDDLAMKALCGVPGKPGLWLAVHNYGLNHYFDYPRDPVNLTAAPVREAEIAWYGIEPELVHGLNEIRALDNRPFYVGDQVLDDSNGFFKFLATAEIFRETIGYLPPAIITEGGWLPGERQDDRYPPVTPAFQANETLRGYKYMQSEAPDWLLAWQPWILCNAACNGSDMRFESHAWYKGRSQNDVLPVVDALKEYAASPAGKQVRVEGGSAGLPWWVGESAPEVIPEPGESLRRTPMELIMDAARRLGRMVYSLYQDSTSLLTLPDPLALTNRYILKNTTSRPVTVAMDGLPAGLELAPYGAAVVEIRPEAMITETAPLTIPTGIEERLALVQLPGESEADFQARQSRAAVNATAVVSTSEPTPITPTAPIPAGGVAAVSPANPDRFGVAEYRRLSCTENPFLAVLFVEVQDSAGQPLDGINLLFNTPDGQNPVTAVSGSKEPGQAEFTLIGYAPPGQRREWTIRADPAGGGSPLVAGIRTDLPDDPCPAATNRTGHYSYKVVFREGAARGIPYPREPLELTPAAWHFPAPRELGETSGPIPLRDWPRPTGDNGRGLHYVPTGYFGEDDGYMLDLLLRYHMAEELDMRWVTLYFKDEIQLRRAAEVMRDSGLVGVFRYDLTPYQDYPAYKIKEHLDILREYGLPPYLQLYNEPTVGQEWRDEAKDLDLYRRNFIAAADEVYRQGGYVGFQDVDVDSLRALLGSIKAQNKAYLFDVAFFVPHCYGSNHPPAYPYDERNQADRPGATIDTDWQISVLCFQKYAHIWQEEAGFVPPMVMGEGGWATNIMEDPRYPRVTMTDHANWHREMFDWFRTGVLSDGEPLPDYLFAVTPWLVHADFQMWVEENAWFYSRLTGTKYETIDQVRAIPPFERRFSWDR